MPREEADQIEKPCIELAIAAGWEHRKLDIGPGGKGWLDGLFLGPKGRYFIAEFKTGDGRVSPKQDKKIKRLQALGHPVWVVRSVDFFKTILIFDGGSRPR